MNGVTTNYYLNGSSIVTQITGNDRLDYFYDENGSLFGFNYNGANYYYVRNGQNDIIGILDSTGTQVVSYQYDTWGKLLGISGSQASGVGTLNPFRYRGYYFDTETGLYYLNSRYYDPNTGRYLNADGICGQAGNILSTNMFTYCMNNPVNMSDPSGCLPKWLSNICTGIKNIAKAVGGFAVNLFDGENNIPIGEAKDDAKGLGTAIKLTKKAEDCKKDMLTEAENTVGINTDPNYKIKSFIENKIMMPPNKQYIEHCKEYYMNAVLSVGGNPLNTRDITGLTWSQLTSDEQNTMAENISIWDGGGETRLLKAYGSPAIDDAIKALY